MQLHPMLQRQVKKCVGEADALDESVKGLLTVISTAYNDFEADKQMAERSLSISSRELEEIVSRLKATLESTTDGILVVDIAGKIVLFNQRFVQMWKIPNEVIVTRDDGRAIAFVLGQLVNPQQFEDKVKQLYSRSDDESFDTLEFKDGQVFERYSRPQKLGDKVLGRVWSFRDVTQKVQNEKILKENMEETERLNKLMVGRELKMVELKEEIARLRSAHGG